ncbi:MAG: hypothetical protein PHC61_18465, partial [Chitinivibrionales bacterium]|nr:hypothetical protein [Chitinivibrionales bacterium]
MSDKSPRRFPDNSLVLYRSSLARVVGSADKITIELADKKTVLVRDKDITLLHPGPVVTLAELTEERGEIEEACGLLAGQTVGLAELAELIYGHFTPSSAWAVCKLLQDGLFLCGVPEAIMVRTHAEYEKEARNRTVKAAEKGAIKAFVERVRQGKIVEDDK